MPTATKPTAIKPTAIKPTTRKATAAAARTTATTRTKTQPEPKPTWLPEPESHDFAAAKHFLDLMLHKRHVESAQTRLRKRRKKLREFAAKDILRASELAGLPADNEGVAAKLAKVREGKPLSPVLLVRPKTGPLIVADGYDRVSAAQLLDESTPVPRVLVSVGKA